MCFNEDRPQLPGRNYALTFQPGLLFFDDEHQAEKHHQQDYRHYDIVDSDTGYVVGWVDADRINGVFSAVRICTVTTVEFKKQCKKLCALVVIGRILWPFSWRLSAFLVKRWG